MITINNVADILTYLQNARPDLDACGPDAFELAIEALRGSVHPVWGSDWEQWLDDHRHMVDEAV
jgi:hypothetical protein